MTKSEIRNKFEIRISKNNGYLRVVSDFLILAASDLFRYSKFEFRIFF